MFTRAYRLLNIEEGEPLDVLVIGGGATGAPVYHELCRLGFRVGLVDRGDFASGTSQASARMIWGGLLYLKTLDIRTVRKLCRARDRLIETMPQHIAPVDMRFLISKEGRYRPWFLMSGLYMYWLLGASARRLPRVEKSYSEESMVRPGRFLQSLTYEEGLLRDSDCRFVQQWISAFNMEDCVPVNHCGVVGGRYVSRDRVWRIELQDRLSGREFPIQARQVVNCGGVWTDEVNALLGIESPYRHVFSKGVFLILDRKPHHRKILVAEMGQHRDVLAYAPWGPVAMWGPTETYVEDCSLGFRADREDVRFLLRAANANLRGPVGPEDIVSLRCGLRPLGVAKGYSKKVYPLELSRRHFVAIDTPHSAISVYGGKLTTGSLIAAEVAGKIKRRIRAGRKPPRPFFATPQPETVGTFAGSHVSPAWSRDNEFCETLDDYLRRRTNISQWTPRMGLGRDSEHLASVRQVASILAGDPETGERMVEDLLESVRRDHDELLRSV